MIPAFKAFAGLSPSCWAVRVQIEHCERALPQNKMDTQIKRDNIRTHFFIAGDFKSKLLINSKSTPYSWEAVDVYTSSAVILFCMRFLSSSFRTTLRILIFFGVTSMHSSCWI